MSALCVLRGAAFEQKIFYYTHYRKNKTRGADIYTLSIPCFHTACRLCILYTAKAERYFVAGSCKEVIL